MRAAARSSRAASAHAPAWYAESPTASRTTPTRLPSSRAARAWLSAAAGSSSTSCPAVTSSPATRSARSLPSWLSSARISRASSAGSPGFSGGPALAPSTVLFPLGGCRSVECPRCAWGRSCPRAPSGRPPSPVRPAPRGPSLRVNLPVCSGRPPRSVRSPVPLAVSRAGRRLSGRPRSTDLPAAPAAGPRVRPPAPSTRRLGASERPRVAGPVRLSPRRLSAGEPARPEPRLGPPSRRSAPRGPPLRADSSPDRLRAPPAEPPPALARPPRAAPPPGALPPARLPRTDAPPAAPPVRLPRAALPPSARPPPALRGPPRAPRGPDARSPEPEPRVPDTLRASPLDLPVCRDGPPLARRRPGTPPAASSGSSDPGRLAPKRSGRSCRSAISSSFSISCRT